LEQQKSVERGVGRSRRKKVKKEKKVLTFEVEVSFFRFWVEEPKTQNTQIYEKAPG